MNCDEQSCLVSWDLDGRVRPIRRVLPATLAAQQAGVRRIIVPLRQAGEAKFVAGIDVFGIASIAQLVALLQGEPMPVVDPIEVIGDPGRQARQALSGPSRRGRAADPSRPHSGRPVNQTGFQPLPESG
jgi:predicted ATPase with chaperone activity